MTAPARDITGLLHAAADGDSAAHDRLYHIAYDELRRLARAQLRRSGGGALQTTELVHEAYVKLCSAQELKARDRNHFFSLSARIMRQIIVDHFRASATVKRGGTVEPLELQDGDVPVAQRGETLLALDRALGRLGRIDGRMAHAVELFFFGGLSHRQVGDVLGVTDRTVRRDLRRARSFLVHELTG